MALKRRFDACLIHGLSWLLILLSCYVSYGTDTDIYCLQRLRKSFHDPFNYTVNWDFTNKTEGAICRFNGIDCWHPDESRVLNIKLTEMSLKGPFPLGLVNCTSMTGLDLSGNNFYGSLPTNISNVIGFVTNLDLSDNNFSGEIPESLSNCSFLNDLNLADNEFSGQIPLQLSGLSRMKSFNVASNNLSGPIPNFNASMPAENYANNPGLCGGPLDKCVAPAGKSHVPYVVGGIAGGLTVGTILIVMASFYISRMKVIRKKDEDPEGNRWAKCIKGTKSIKVSMFEKSVSKMSLKDLMEATNSFSNTNMIGSGRTGAMYKATMSDGTLLMVKRLQDSQRTEKEFMSEMQTLGSVKHQNLVPLLGFCIAKKVKFLVYQYMANGNLYDQLHPSDPEANTTMEWPTRLKIAIGTAKGLAWLHHSCNPRILHRNISSKCVLLDEDFEPKLSDFGLARLMNPVDTHLSTFVNGEFGDLGYVAPEYPRKLIATPKGDVYSFGVVLLEIVTGEKATHVANAPEDFKGSLVEWITQLANSDLRSAIEKSLLDKGVDDELLQFIRVARTCVSDEPKERPTMFEVYQLLRAIGEKYNFTAYDEMPVPTDIGGADFAGELIVSQV